MPAKSNSLKIGFFSVAFAATALFAQAAEVRLPAAAGHETAPAVDSVEAASPQRVAPIRHAGDAVIRPAAADSAAGVTFRAPRRPSQLKRVPAEEGGTGQSQGAAADAEEAAETGPLPETQDVPQTLPAEDGVSPAEVPQAVTPRAGTMSFNGIEPGQTTVMEMKQQWGEPESASIDGETGLLTFEIPPFQQIDATTQGDLVTSIVVYLDPPMLPGKVATELKLREFTPVPIPDGSGQLLGQVYPERGVLFGFAANTKLPRVAQIVVEPITGEPFVLRALYDFQHRYSANLKDLDFAIELNEEDAQAHWVKSRVLVQIGRYEEAFQVAEAAVRLDPSVTAYVLHRARLLGIRGLQEEAVELIENMDSPKDLPQQEKAQIASVMGFLLATGAAPDHKSAVQHYQAAIDLATPLVSDKRFEVRRAAKQVLVEANAGIGLSIALGNYQQKAEVTAKWFDRAGVYAEQFVAGDNGPKDLTLKIAALRLAASAAVGKEVDPTKATDTAIEAGRQLIAWSDDPLFKSHVEWLLATALMEAVRLEHVRGNHLAVLRYADLAVAPLESAAAERKLSPGEQFAMGRFYFLAGAVHAVQKQDHEEAAHWYAKSVPLITSPVAVPTDRLASGRLGEWMVSMGVTFWEVSQQEEALEMTERGADLIKQAVSEGVMKAPALTVPYANLAAMHKSLGHVEQASGYSELAKQSRTGAETQLR